MTKRFRNLLAAGAMSALAVSLSACGPDSTQERAALALTDSGLEPGWSMGDLAGVDPAFIDGDSLPQALPMRAGYDGGYQYAPAYDYTPEDDGDYYEPLDDSYYEDDSDAGDYALLALASALGGMLGDAPPDYGFGYDGVEPWAWQTADDYVRYAEPVEGGYRYYYYEPDAARPFLVRDPYYSYGYRGDRLVVIYDRGGRIVDYRRAERQRQAAQAYYARAERMYRASHEHRHGIAAPLWAQHRDDVARDRGQWQQASEQRQGWRQWEAQNQQRLHREWSSEALVRRDAERQFSGWQKADYRTPAPDLYSQQAHEAQVRQVAALRQERAQQQRAAEQSRARQIAEARAVPARQAAERRQDERLRPAVVTERRERVADAPQRVVRQQAQAAARDDRQQQAQARRTEQAAQLQARQAEQARQQQAARQEQARATAQARTATAARERQAQAAQQAQARTATAARERQAQAAQQAQARRTEQAAQQHARQQQVREPAASQAQARAAAQAQRQTAARERQAQTDAQATQRAAQARREAQQQARQQQQAQQQAQLEARRGEQQQSRPQAQQAAADQRQAAAQRRAERQQAEDERKPARARGRS